jgi:hypothetical protein
MFRTFKDHRDGLPFLFGMSKHNEWWNITVAVIFSGTLKSTLKRSRKLMACAYQPVMASPLITPDQSTFFGREI